MIILIVSSNSNKCNKYNSLLKVLWSKRWIDYILSSNNSKLLENRIVCNISKRGLGNVKCKKILFNLLVWRKVRMFRSHSRKSKNKIFVIV